MDPNLWQWTESTVLVLLGMMMIIDHFGVFHVDTLRPIIHSAIPVLVLMRGSLKVLQLTADRSGPPFSKFKWGTVSILSLLVVIILLYVNSQHIDQRAAGRNTGGA